MVASKVDEIKHLPNDEFRAAMLNSMSPKGEDWKAHKEFVLHEYGGCGCPECQ